MRKTTFAGLTVIEPGEPLTVDGASFYRNPEVIDHFLRLGAKTHRHDGHPPLADPADPPDVTTDPAGGTLPPDLTVSIAYTLLDEDGGETLPSPVGTVTTPAPLDPPAAPTLTLDTTAGGLVADVYAYLVTLVDALGGETTAGTIARITRDPGPATARVVIGGLTALLAEPGAVSWRLFRAKGSGDFDLLATGAGASFTDDGTTPVDCGVQPPDTNSTNGANQVTITLPVGAVPAGATGWRLYATTSGDFTSPALVGVTRLPATAGDPIVLGAIDVDDGAPPDVSTSVGGAANIPMRAPVATAAALPTVGNGDGDLRVTLDDHILHVWSQVDALWTSLGGATAGMNIDGVTYTEVDLYGGISSVDLGSGQLAIYVGMRGLSGDDFSNVAALADPGYITQNVARDAGPPTALMASAAGADGRLFVKTDPTAPNADSPLRSHAKFLAPAVDDKFGATVKTLDLANFIEGRVNNAAGAAVLELLTVDANVETVLASLPLAAPITTRCWLRTEINVDGMSGLGEVLVALYLAYPDAYIAAPTAILGAELDATANTKYGQGVVAGYGLRLVPAAAGANALRATGWLGAMG